MLCSRYGNVTTCYNMLELLEVHRGTSPRRTTSKTNTHSYQTCGHARGWRAIKEDLWRFAITFSWYLDHRRLHRCGYCSCRGAKFVDDIGMTCKQRFIAFVCIAESFTGDINRPQIDEPSKTCNSDQLGQWITSSRAWWFDGFPLSNVLEAKSACNLL